jgi:sialate O-acetylesterase
MPTPRTPLLALLCLAACQALSAADIRLPALFSDHMVLQRDKAVAVWGWADADEEISVEFAGQKKTAKADASGKWSLRLDPLTASAESRKLTATGKDSRKAEVSDVLVGDVWLGSGQSNMEMAVAGVDNAAAEQAAANLPLIRYFVESSGPAENPQTEGKGLWQPCTPANVRRFSATLFFFGREIHREIDVPVGLINSSVGATHIESWVSAEAQSSDPETKAEFDSQMAGIKRFSEEKLRAEYPKQLAAWQLAFDNGKASLKDKPWTPEMTIATLKRKGPLAGLYNGKIYNLAPFTLRGILWYQGESNAGKPELYRKQLSALVTSWRTLWQDELPFAWVQLPNFGSPGEGWPRMREAMLQALALPKTGMAITIDIGDIKNIHPTNKQEVGRRLSLWALGTVYGKKVAATSGPLPAGHEIKGAEVIVTLSHADGLKTRDGSPIKGLQLAGADKQWKLASAKIDGAKLIVTSGEVAAPVALRYAWLNNPEVNLVNGAGLPASPFRTDDWAPIPSPAPAAKGKAKAK